MSYASLTAQQLSDFLDRYGSMGKDIMEIQLMEIKLNNFTGRYDKARALLEKMNYHIEEGARFNPHVLWFDANLQTGIKHMKNKKYALAEKSFLKAMEFPANLEAERDGKIGIAYYYLGLNAKLTKDIAKAESWFTKMINYTYNKGWGAGDFPELDYFRALASIELGRDKSEAEKLFKKLIENGIKRINPVKDSRNITVTVDDSHAGRTFLLEHELGRKGLRVSSYYMQGLGHLGLDDKEKARSFFTKALEIEPLNIDVNLMLQNL